MLSVFRRFATSRVGIVVTFAVLILIAIAFATSDVSDLTGGNPALSTTAVATVDGETITEAALTKRAQDDLEGFRQQQPALDMAQYIAGGGFDGTLNRIVAGAAFEKFGEREGIRLGKRLIDGQLASIPALQGPTGQFSLALYQRILAERRMKDADVRADLRRSTMARLLTGPDNGASPVPFNVALPYASSLLERRTGEIALIPTRALGTGTPPTDAELATFYNRNIARYTVPERRVIRYASVTADSVKAQAVPSEAEVAQAYATDRAKFAATEKRGIAQVTVLDQAAANVLAARVKAGTPLADAARAAGLEARTVTGVEKAAYARQTSAAVADAAFAAARGTVIGPVRGAIGFIVARVEAIEQVPGKTLDQARPEIVAALTTQKTADAIGRIHDALDDAINANANFSELVADQKLTAATTGPILPGGVNPDQPAVKPDPALGPIIAAGFAAQDGDTPTLVQTAADGSFAVVALDRIVRAAPRPLTQVRAAVVADFTADRASRAVRKIAIDVVAKIDKGLSLSQALAETKLATPKIEAIDAVRGQIASSPQGAPPPIALMFTMAGASARMLEAPNKAGWLIVKLNSITPGDARRQPSLVKATQGDLARLLGREYVEQFAEAVKAAVGVTKNAAAIAKVKADLTGGSNQP